MVEYHPISVRDQSRLHQFGKKVLPGTLLGYALISKRVWEGDILIADLEELEKMDATEMYPGRVNAKEVLISQREKNSSSRKQMIQQNCQEEITNSENPLQGGNRP